MVKFIVNIAVLTSLFMLIACVAVIVVALLSGSYNQSVAYGLLAVVWFILFVIFSHVNRTL